MSKLTRRSLLSQSAGIATALAVGPCEELFAFDRSVQPKSTGGSPGRVAQIVSLDTVTLGDGPFRDAMDRNGAYLLSLEPDRFLHYFRKSAGLAPKADPYGGWEEKVGRMLGHYLSACSMYVRAESDPAFLKRQNYIVEDLAECQRANGDGYVGGVADAKRIFSEIRRGNIYRDKVGLNGVHAPWYMLHKMCAGLRDAYTYGGNQQALQVLVGFSNWADNLTGPLSHADMQKMLEEEHGGMNEIFADVFAITSDKKFLTLSRRFNHVAVLEPLTSGVDDLDGLHANTQIPTVLGLYRQYEVAGDSTARRGGEFFWQTVTHNRSYVIGGNSDRERFFPKGAMAQNLSVATAETCNSYNMVKLTDRLFAGEPREELAAYDERVLWNHILASQDKTTPGLAYYLSLKPGHFKTFSKPHDSFWCCVGTGMENHAKYGESIYFRSADELWINQFIASELHWPEKKMRIKQVTTFPHEQVSRWEVVCERPVKATFYVRHPKWAGRGFALTVNGKSAGASDPGSYLKVKRVWRNGDTLAASLPMTLWVEPMRDDPSLNALLFGPLVLAGLLGRGEMPAEAPYAGNSQLQFRSVPDPGVPALASLAPRDLSATVRQTGPLEFNVKSSGPVESITFVPLAWVTRDRYSVYWKTA